MYSSVAHQHNYLEITRLNRACRQRRLDAIGAIGIARCFTYGGAKKRVLHDPGVPPSASLTQAEYMDRSREQTTINHFHEKLLKLKGMMKTDTGRRIAEQRHAFMISYLEEFTQEWNATL